jgi:phosphohistidine phosphatase SixA
LIIIRHAHRYKLDGGKADNGLSKKGRKQAKALTRYFKKQYAKEKALLLSSPKVRCTETLVGIEKIFRTAVRKDLLLLEQNENESITQFKARIAKFKEFWINKGGPFTVICSHGDWIPLAFEAFIGKTFDLDKGGLAEISLESKKDGPVLRTLIQDFTRALQ